MNESMDITFLVVTMSSADRLLSAVTHTISSILNPLIENNCDIRLALVISIPDNDVSASIVYSFTNSFNTFKNWFTTSHGSQQQHNYNGTIDIHAALQEVLHLEWRTTNRKDHCHENIVFLITDGFPCQDLVNPNVIDNDNCACACDELWTISNEFLKQNLTLVIIGIGPIVSVCDGLYASIATNTGGGYVPLINANDVLFLSIQSIITQGYTLSQSLRHITQKEFAKNSSFHHSVIHKQDEHQSLIKHCRVMAQRGAWLLDHFSRV